MWLQFCLSKWKPCFCVYVCMHIFIVFGGGLFLVVVFFWVLFLQVCVVLFFMFLHIEF